MEIKTKYPILLVHGILARDKTKSDRLKTWGNLPCYLCKHGVKVFFGNTDACGSIKDNANKIKETVEKIINKYGYEKVNIIAHSKGGIESRYAITKLGIHDKVASLTTINTPHRGAALADIAVKAIPEKIYRKITTKIDKDATAKGDAHADFYASSHELTTKYCDNLNKELPDSDDVVYQSITLYTKIGPPYYWPTKLLLWIFRNKQNDGIVSKKSSIWGHEISRLPIKYCNHGELTNGKASKKRRRLIIALYVAIISSLIALHL